VRALKWPGLMVQKITTAEPDDRMLEVALVSLKASLGYENPLGDLVGEIYQPEDKAAAAAIESGEAGKPSAMRARDLIKGAAAAARRLRQPRP
jgi:hypothetical protein